MRGREGHDPQRVRRAGSAALAVACAVLGVTLAPAARAATSTTGTDAGILQLADQTPTVDPEGTFTAQISAVGAPVDARIRVVLHGRVTTRSQFALTLGGTTLGTTLATPVRTLPLDGLPHSATDTFIVSIPIRAKGTDTSRLRLSSAGVYPVEVDLVDTRGATIDQLITHLVRLPDSNDNPALAVALVVPFHGRPALGHDGTITLDDADRSGLVKTAAELQRAPDVPLSILATPETLDALAAATEAGDDDLLASLTAATAGREVLGAPYVDLDLGEWSSPTLAPVFADQLSRGADVLSERLSDATGDAWVADASLDETALARLHAEGVTRIVVPDAGLEPLDADTFRRTLTRQFEIGPAGSRMSAAAADAALAAYAGATTDPVLDAEHLVADLATLYFDEPGSERGVVVRIPDSWQPDAAFLGAALAGMAPSVLFRPVTLDQFFTSVPASDPDGGDADGGDPLIRTLSPQPGHTLEPYRGAIVATNAALDTYRSAIGPDSPRADPLDRRMLVGAAADLPASERLSYFDAVTGTIGAELAKVDAPPGQSITLTARSGRIPITVRNSAGYPLQVTLRLESDRLEFPELTNGTTTLILKGPSTRVEIAVRARASGDSPLDVAIVTPDGRVELDTTTYRVRSTAVSGAGLLLSIGAGAFLLVWWGRTIRRDRRRRRALAPAGRHARPVAPA
jgi:hypothetical protein